MAACGFCLPFQISKLFYLIQKVQKINKDSNKPCTSQAVLAKPFLSWKWQLDLGGKTHNLTVIIYHQNEHLQSEKLVAGRKYNQGWYLCNDMWKNGIAEYTGKHPHVNTLPYLHIQENHACLYNSFSVSDKCQMINLQGNKQCNV